VNLNDAVWTYLNAIEDKSKINLSMDKFKDLGGENELFPFHSCEGHFFSPILDASGDINVCMYHPNDDRFNFGNINKNNLMDIWNGEKRQQVISFLRSKLDYCSECQVCCKLYELNKFIEFIKYPNPKLDINFL
jgi:radical SAM protein with 4Fe4S-binding SPASM domain